MASLTSGGNSSSFLFPVCIPQILSSVSPISMRRSPPEVLHPSGLPVSSAPSGSFWMALISLPTKVVSKLNSLKVSSSLQIPEISFVTKNSHLSVNQAYLPMPYKIYIFSTLKNPLA